MRHAFASALVLALTACASAAPVTPAAPSAEITGYFNVDDFHPDRILAGPPATDSPLGRAELETVRQLVAGSSAERHALAVADNNLDVWQRFETPLGAHLAWADLPVTTNLFRRAYFRGEELARRVKAPFNRVRPLVADPTINFCWPEQRRGYERDLSYPSGHSAWGWSVALMLAEMVPERADAILTRGREIGDSRVICGVHFPSDVEAGRLYGAAFVNRLRATPAFNADFARARAEVRAALGLPG